MNRVIENCRNRLNDALQDARRLQDQLAILEAEETTGRRNPAAGFGADIPVTLDEDSAWATL